MSSLNQRKYVLTKLYKNFDGFEIDFTVQPTLEEMLDLVPLLEIFENEQEEEFFDQFDDPSSVHDLLRYCVHNTHGKKAPNINWCVPAWFYPEERGAWWQQYKYECDIRRIEPKVVWPKGNEKIFKKLIAEL